VIYGDIGTSPLYVYSSTFTAEPSKDDLLGALSLIIWSLTLIVTFKYILIVLAADDEGEGGTFAICESQCYHHINTHSDIDARYTFIPLCESSPTEKESLTTV
jgi:K+ transporter